MAEKITKEELVELVRKIVGALGTEEEIDGWINVLEENVPDPEVSDLIFYPDKEMTPEEVIERALSYRSIHL